jgi:glutamate/aspartate transport system substrate-binding protein
VHHGRARILRRLSYTLGDGKFAGFHVEICQRVLADVQKQLGLAKLDIKYQPVTSQNRIPLVQNGTVDIECGSTTNNATRQKDVSFAVTTYVEEVRIAVKANSGITSIASSTARTWPPPPAPPRCRPCASTSAPPA